MAKSRFIFVTFKYAVIDNYDQNKHFLRRVPKLPSGPCWDEKKMMNWKMGPTGHFHVYCFRRLRLIIFAPFFSDSVLNVR